MNDKLKNEIEELLAIARPELLPYKDVGEVKMIEQQLAARFLNVITMLLQENENLKKILRNYL